MTELRIESINDPIAESPESVRWALATIFRAELMGLLPEGAEEERVIVVDSAYLSDLASCARAAGIGRGLRLRFDSVDLEDDLTESLRSLWQALDESPYPEGEWGAARERLGDEQLSQLLDISISSLRRYAGRARETPDAIAWRLHTLTRIIASLSGSYNDYGIRRWFERPRAQLDGQTPAEVFRHAEGEDDRKLQQLVELAEALVGPAVAA